MVSKKGDREYRQIAGERFPVECIHHIMVDSAQIEHYKKCAIAANAASELEIKEQRIHNPDVPIKTFMIIETKENQNGWFGVTFWAAL